MRRRPLRMRTTGARGSSLIEFSLILPLLLLLFFGAFDFGRILYIQLTLQSAVREASRLTVTGNVLPDPEHPETYLGRVESIIHRIQTVAPGLHVTPDQISITGPGGAGDPGGPGDLVTIRVDYEIEILTPLVRPVFPEGVYPCAVTMISRNEPFPGT
ncbi:MAG: pilus assembly protein [Candidatus Eisenbacteria bacterium]|nr:pilus assembly protein [Candidatus Eisenbacteria bacterium]